MEIGGTIMIKFNDYTYAHPDIDELKKQFEELISLFNRAESFEEQDALMKDINEVRNDYESMYTLVSIRHSINTNDEFYEKENDYFDEINPVFEGLISEYYRALIQSKHRDKLEEKCGKHLFKTIELQLKTFSQEIIPDLQQENKLSSEYDKLVASAKIMFDGEERNLAGMGPYKESKDRETRKAAWEAYTQFFEDNEEKFDMIYDQLVKVRTKIAKKLGYDNFVNLAYDRMLRSDYDAQKVANYRQQVFEELVPLASELLDRQRKRLGYDRLTYYDESLKFLSGNPNPKGDSQWIINNGKKMYEELSKETSEFIHYMIDHNLLDLVSKKGKVGGGYCTYIPNYHSPFIFSNFNGTAGDVDVLTHEAGHAFQVYSSKGYELPEYHWPTYEACEIHSMSMEFLTYPWMKNFFKEDVEKYKYYHLSEAVIFIPYGVTVDEFQHWVYENPEATPTERKEAWRRIEKKYLPLRDYEDNSFMDRGGFWFKQGHIFGTPFYYIDYTLAQVCAFQFWIKATQNREEAWNDYLTLCKAGGSKSFLKLVELADLKNPFEDGCIRSVVGPIKDYLNTIDDSRL